MNIYPYVYRLDHPITGEFYIGLRCANKVPASEDLGHKYFTSSKTVKLRFNEFQFTVMAEFFDRDAAYYFEQQSISECLHDQLCLNKACYFMPGEIKFSGDVNRGRKQSEEEIRKRAASLRGRILSEERKQRLRKPKPPGFSQLLREANLGKKLSECTKDKLRLISTGKVQNEETKSRRRDTMAALMWVNNGEINKRVFKDKFDELIKDGWLHGRCGKSNQYQ